MLLLRSVPSLFKCFCWRRGLGARNCKPDLAGKGKGRDYREKAIAPRSQNHPKLFFFFNWSIVGASQVALMINNPPANVGDATDVGLTPGCGRSCRRAWPPTPVFLSVGEGEAHGQRSLASYSPEGRRESDTTEVT